LSCEIPVIHVILQRTVTVFTEFQKILTSEFMKIRSTGAELLHPDGWVPRHK